MLRELGSFERALLLSDRHAPFHLVSALQIDGAPVPDVLQAAWAALQQRHPLLTACIVERNRRFYFESIGNRPIPLSVLERRGDEDWIAVVESEQSRRIDTERGPLLRCTYLFQSKGTRAEVIVAVSHSILDAPGLVFIWHELLSLCQQLEERRTPEVSALPLQPPADDLFPAGFRGLSRAGRIVPYLLRQIGGELSYRRKTWGQSVLPLHASSSGHILTMRFSSSLTDAIGHRARLEHVTLNSLLNAAMMLAVNRHLYGGRTMPMRAIVFATLRPYVVPPITGPILSPYISMLRYTVMVGPGRGMWDVAHDLQTQIQVSFRRGDKFVAALLSDDLMKMFTRLHAFRMANTALSFNGPINLKSYGSISVIGVHGHASPFDLGPEYSAQVNLFNGELWWDITFLESDMDRELARKIADEICASVENAVSGGSRNQLS